MPEQKEKSQKVGLRNVHSASVRVHAGDGKYVEVPARGEIEAELPESEVAALLKSRHLRVSKGGLQKKPAAASSEGDAGKSE